MLGSLGLTEQKRRGYEAYLEGRVLGWRNKAGRAELEEQWKQVRRGWYLGRESFLERLEAWLDKALAGKRRESHSGGAGERHDVVAAERLLARGLKALALKEPDLEGLPLREPEKVALAWRLRKQTTVSLRWVTERLRMGHYTSVTQAVYRMNHQPGRKLLALPRAGAQQKA